MIKKLWEKVVNFYIYSLFAGPIALVLLMSGDQDYIVNKMGSTDYPLANLSSYRQKETIIKIRLRNAALFVFD